MTTERRTELQKLLRDGRITTRACRSGTLGAVSGKQGNSPKREDVSRYFEDPTALGTMRPLNTSFAPHRILDPGLVFP